MASLPRSPSRQNVEELSLMMDVTNSNFIEQSNDFMKHLPNASWISLDEEMTGIMLPNSKKPNKADSPEDRYESLKAIPERYSMIQLGICLFEEASTTSDHDSTKEKQGVGGICQGEAKFHVRRYKFSLFPPADNSITREMTFNPSSIHFLAQNNMNFDHMVRAGIPFVTKDDANRLAEKFHEKQERLAREEKERLELRPSTSYNDRRAVQLTRIEDKNFHARSMASLREWLDAAIILPPPTNMNNTNNDNDNNNDNNDQNNNRNNNTNNNNASEGASFLLPPCNSFLRRSLYETIPKEYPNLVLETTQTSQIRVLRLNPQERQRRKERLLREDWERLLNEKVGMYRIFLALTRACTGTLYQPAISRAEQTILAPTVKEAMEPFIVPSPTTTTTQQQNVRKIPLVVHNGLQDMLFLMTHFHTSQLPDTWWECKRLLHNYFPVIYDTKTMALEYSKGNSGSSGRNPPTHLAAVYERALLNYPQWNRTFVPNDGNTNSDNNAEQAHDAAYDAYMTGAAFSGLSCDIQSANSSSYNSNKKSRDFKIWNCNDSDETATFLYGRNKMHFHLSPYTIDLEQDDDPLGRGMSLHSTYRIADIDESVSTRDIVQCLSGLIDSHGARVNFEIIWVDDTTFLVAAMIPNCRDLGRFREHGEILFRALSGTFTKENIQCLVDFKGGRKETSTGSSKSSSSSSSLWTLWGILGKKKKRQDDEGERKAKRRRFS